MISGFLSCACFLMLPALAVAPDYARDVHPIWKKYCFSCHFTGVKMGGLELGTYEELMRGGNTGQDIVAGQSSESRLFLMITEKYQPYMPLGGMRLTAAEIETIRSWIDAGAKGPAKTAHSGSASLLGSGNAKLSRKPIK